MMRYADNALAACLAVKAAPAFVRLQQKSSTIVSTAVILLLTMMPLSCCKPFSFYVHMWADVKTFLHDRHNIDPRVVSFLFLLWGCMHCEVVNSL